MNLPNLSLKKGFVVYPIHIHTHTHIYMYRRERGQHNNDKLKDIVVSFPRVS